MPVLPKSLLNIPATGVTSRITGEESKDKQEHEKGDNSVNDDFKGYHD